MALTNPPPLHQPTRSLDQVETELRARLEEISKLQTDLMRLLREADGMQAATVDGARTMAEWAGARLDLAPETARTLVETARALECLPELEEGLRLGLLSYDRTVELVRAVAAGVDVSDHRSLDVAGLRRVISMRRTRARTTDREAHDARYLMLQPSLDRSRWRLHGLLPGSDGARVEAALDRRADRLTARTGSRPPLARRRADALVDLCETTEGSTTTEPLMTVFVDAHAATADGYLPIGPDAVDETACLGRVEAIDITDRARPLARGRSTRVISRRLRRMVLHRDGGQCTVAGCQSRYRLQPHHVVPWSEGGSTDPDNLATLCWYHHHVVVHGRGRRLDPTSPAQRRRFIREPGRAPPT